METELRNAIRKRRKISFTYTEKEGTISTIVCPTKIGELTSGNDAIEGYWVAGESISGKMPPWRLYLLDRISDLVILDETFSSVGNEYKPTDKRFVRIDEHI